MSRKFSTVQMLPQIEKHLLLDERLLWLDKPHPRRMLSQPVDGVDPLSILILGVIVAVLMGLILLTGNSDSPVALSVLLVILLASAATVPSIGQYIRAKNTTYAITTHRALIIEGNHVQSFGAGDITCVERRELDPQWGDVIFKKVTLERWIPSGYMPIPTSIIEEIGFFGIRHAEYVEDTLLHALRESPISLWQDTTVPPDTQARQQAAAQA